VLYIALCAICVRAGIDITHEDLQTNVVTGASFVGGVQSNVSFKDQAGHGTFVAGEIGATTNNGLGVTGVAQLVSLYICQFIGASGDGDISSAALCIDWCLANNVHVISSSWGSSQYLQTLDAAVGTVSTRGVVFVASAGNSGLNTDTTPQYPSGFSAQDDGVISVAAVDSTGALWSGSNYGNRTVTLAAPGVQLRGLGLGSTYTQLTGTSMASEYFRATRMGLDISTSSLTSCVTCLRVSLVV